MIGPIQAIITNNQTLPCSIFLRIFASLEIFRCVLVETKFFGLFWFDQKIDWVLFWNTHCNESRENLEQLRFLDSIRWKHLPLILLPIFRKFTGLGSLRKTRKSCGECREKIQFTYSLLMGNSSTNLEIYVFIFANAMLRSPIIFCLYKFWCFCCSVLSGYLMFVTPQQRILSSVEQSRNWTHPEHTGKVLKTWIFQLESKKFSDSTLASAQLKKNMLDLKGQLSGLASSHGQTGSIIFDHDQTFVHSKWAMVRLCLVQNWPWSV